MPNEVKMIQDAQEDELWSPSGHEDLEEGEEEYDDGKPLYNMVRKDNDIIFQRSERRQLDVVKDGDNNNLEQTPAQTLPFPRSQSTTVSEDGLESLRSRITLIAQMSSPKIRVTHNHHQSIMTIDEGSELNAVSDEYAIKNDIELKPSSRKATAAGNNKLEIVGESLNDLIVDTKFGSKRFSLNLGKVSVIANVGCPMILAHPPGSLKVKNFVTRQPASCQPQSSSEDL